MSKSVRVFSLFLVNDTRLRSNFKNLCFVFPRGFQALKNNKITWPTACAFVSFLVFGNPDEILALVFEILHVTCLETNMRRKHFANAESGHGILRKRELFHHSHSLSIFLFQSDTSVKGWKVNEMPREEGVARRSVLKENNTHKLTHALFSLLNN